MTQNGAGVRQHQRNMAEAADVYLLMKEEYRISRNTRAAWFFDHLNQTVTPKSDEELLQSKEELEVLSVLPVVEESSHDSDEPSPTSYEILPSTHISFLARRYRMVFILDFSPSMASVDIQLGKVNIMNSFTCLSNCLRGLIQPFHVPGSSCLLSPMIYITVVAYTPVSALTTQQVLVQGALITADVIDEVLEILQQEIETFENKLFNCVNETDHGGSGNFLRAQDGGLSVSQPDMALPESCFMNMLWCGILALQLLPPNTSAGIVVITDGVIGVREDPILNNALAKLRDSTIACSFIQVGHGFLPHSAFGYIPHTEIMQFIATATQGSFLDQCPEVCDDSSHDMNIYHTALLVWSFQKDINPLKGYQQSMIPSPKVSETFSSGKSIGLRMPRFPNLPLQRVKHREEALQTGLFTVMAVRLREGFTIKQVTIHKSKGVIEVRLALSCAQSGQIEYVAKSQWPPTTSRRVTHVEVVMEGTYDFIHDINCPLNKMDSRSLFKTRVIKNFWQIIRSLRDADRLLVHMHSFAANPAYYVVPEGTSKGMPLFYMPPNSDTPVLAQQHVKKDESLAQFAQFWKRIALMEPRKWQRWLHTHQIAMLLMPDLPLPKHLHHPNSSGRFVSVQCKLAQKELNALLTDWATFILLENHSYINITYEDKNSPPTSFFIIRVICKGLMVVLRLAFLGGTPAYVRYKIVNELKEKLAGLSMSQKLIHRKDPTRITKGRKISIKRGEDPKPTFRKPCVLLVKRPMEVILVKYEKMPSGFTDLKLSSEVTAPSVPVYMNRGPDKSLNRLACYLHHRRWIWDAQGDQQVQISPQTVLSVLTRFKLQQGFHIAYSQSGIISFITELNLQGPCQLSSDAESEAEQLERTKESSDGDADSDVEDGDDDKSEADILKGVLDKSDEEQDEGRTKVEEGLKCLVQYVIFPPHVKTLAKLQNPEAEPLEDMDMIEADGKLQLITECWVEPQCGTIVDSPEGRGLFDGQQYMNVPDLLYPSDDEIVHTLLSYEHLKAMCKIKEEGSSISPHVVPSSKISISESITNLPFSLDILHLIPKCRQLELICSTFLDGPVSRPREGFQYPKPNETLFSLLLSSLSSKSASDFKLTLIDEQSLKFSQFILEKDYSERNKPPFKITKEEIDGLLSDMERIKLQQRSRARSASELGESKNSGRRDRADTIDEDEVLSKIPRWTCFVRGSVSENVMLVVTPASYNDLLRLQGKAHVPLVDMESDSSAFSVPVNPERAARKETESVDEKRGEREEGQSKSEASRQSSRESKVTKGRRKRHRKSKRISREEPKISYDLPVFVYECSLSSLTNILLKKDTEKSSKDILKDITFASMERSNVPGTPRSMNRLSHSRFLSDSDEFSESSKKTPMLVDPDKPHMSRELEWYFSLLSNKVHKAFVIALFKSLQQGQNVDREDVMSAIDNICAESLHEIDITNYVQAVCGHVREAGEVMEEENEKNDSHRRQLRFAAEAEMQEDTIEEDDQTQESLEDKDAKISEGNETTISEEKGTTASAQKREISYSIPVSAFLSRQTCEVQAGLHSLIKNKFTEIMGRHFQQIPDNENYWFHTLHDYDDCFLDRQYSSQSQPTTQDEVETSGTEFIGERDLLQAESLTKLTEPPHVENTSESNTSGKEEDAKINSIVDNYLINLKRSSEVSQSIDGCTSVMSLCGSTEEEISPLFVTLVCSIKLKSNVGNMPVQTIPTCLGVLLDCLESPEERITLGDLHLTLDLICLTLPPDFDVCTPYDEEDSEHSDRRRGISFSEPSPPDSPPAELIRNNGRSGLKLLSVSEYDDLNTDFVDDSLKTLPDHQKAAIQATQDEIKWLLKDEIASARRHIFPVTVDTLDMVASHVCNSLNNKTCLYEQVDLKFVFGPEQSLSEFVKAFEEIKVTGYKLNKIHEHYYLSLDQMASSKDLDGSWPSDQFDGKLPSGSRSKASIDVSETAGDVATKITFTPPSPQRHSGTEQETKDGKLERVPNSEETLTKEDGERKNEDGIDRGEEEEQNVKKEDTSQIDDTAVSSKKNEDEPARESSVKVEVSESQLDEGGGSLQEGDLGKSTQTTKMQGESGSTIQEGSRRSSVASSGWESTVDSFVNPKNSDSDSDIQVLSDIPIPDSEGKEYDDSPRGQVVEEEPLSVGSLGDDEDSQRTLTRSSGITVLQQRKEGFEEEQAQGRPQVTGKWSTKSATNESESSLSSHLRSDSSFGFIVDSASQEKTVETVYSAAPGGGVEGAKSPGKEAEGFGDLDEAKGVGAVNEEDRTRGRKMGTVGLHGKFSPDKEEVLERQDSGGGTETGSTSVTSTPAKQRTSSGDSNKVFSPRERLSRVSVDSTVKTGRTRDTPRSRQTSSTGGTTTSGPLSTQVSCNSLSGSLTEYDEEGYEAGPSEDEFADSHVFSEDDFNAKHKMPDFWLILKVQEDREELENENYKMNMYFHTRDRGDQVRLEAQKEIFNEVGEAIKKTTRLVSQRLLLIDLFDSKVCNPLLLPDEENWNKDDYIRRSHGRIPSEADANVHEERDYLAARLDFDPGHFACDEQWRGHLVVHPRLPSSRKGGGKVSGGMQAVKAAMDAFAISNRSDLYVVKDDSEEVFYIRLSEQSGMSQPTSSRTSLTSDSFPVSEPGSSQVSRVPSFQNLVTDEDSVSNMADSGRDSLSESLKMAANLNRSILVTVYGLTTPGLEIHRDLISLLQKRLDQVTLDVIKDMLDKNAMSRLTPGDVQFIQPPDKAPSRTVQFTIPLWSVQYIYAIGFYLQQNLLEILYIPKYVDSKPQSHFQDYTLKDQVKGSSFLLDKDIFLYNRPHRAGGTGIACIIASVVDGKSRQINWQSCTRPSPEGYHEILPSDTFQEVGDQALEGQWTHVDFQQLTSTKEYQPSRIGAKGPGPTFLIQFNIWERGNADIANLITKLEGAVHHALCDVIMEYRILTAPLASLPSEVTAKLTGDSVGSLYSPTVALRAELFRKMGPSSSPVVPQTVPMKTSESSSLTSYTPITPPDMPRSAEPSQPPATHPVKIVKRSTGSTPKSSSISSVDSASKSSKRQLIFDRKETAPSSDGSPLPSQPTSPTKPMSTETSPRISSREEPSWQAREHERRYNEELNRQLKEAEDGQTGRLHPIYSNVTKKWLEFEINSKICSIQKMTKCVQSRFSVDLVLFALIKKLPQVCSDTSFKLFRNTSKGYELYQPATPKKNRFASTQGQQGSIPKPGNQESFVLIGRNVHQWRYSLDYNLSEEETKAPNLTNPQSRKSYQQFSPCDLSAQSARDDSRLLALKGNSQSLHLVPRQRLFLLYIIDKQFTLYTYNWSLELVQSFRDFFHRLIMWHNSRSHLMDCLVMQKMGLYHHKPFGDTGQEDNPFCKSMGEIDSLVKQLVPPNLSSASHGPSTSLPRSQRRRHAILPPFDETMAIGKIPRPLHTSHYNAWRDPVLRHGAQLQEVCNQARKDSDVQNKLRNLFFIWQQKKRSYQPISVDTLETLKQQSRLLTHCATPILFSPLWRKQVLADDDCEPISQSPGGSVHEESWHMGLRYTFLQQYIQYLTMKRFHQIETTKNSPKTSFSLTSRHGKEGQLPEGRGRRVRTASVRYMQITVLGGIILAELSFEHVFFCVRLYAFESSRLPRELNINSRLGMLFTDECDSFKDLIHLHSFSYDFHLRTVQEYLSSPEMGFKIQYHITSFLSDFIKFFNPIPRFCSNLIHSETQGFLSHNTPAPDLYEYLTKHKLAEFFLLNMNKPEESAEQEQENALVSFSRLCGRFRASTSSGSFLSDEINVSFIISWDEDEYESSTRPGTPVPGFMCESGNAANAADSEKNKNLMRLKYFLIINSMKHVFPAAGVMSSVMGAELESVEKNPRFSYMMSEMQKKRDLVKKLVREAATYCRRDMLWNKLLEAEGEKTASSKKTKKKDASEDKAEQEISYAEFNVLLESTKRFPLTATDKSLISLLDNNRQWYENLLTSLRSKFNVMARYFKSEDGMIHQLALLNQVYQSMVVLLTVDFQSNAVELEAVYRTEQDVDCMSMEDSQTQPELHCQKHIETVINAVCFHLWTSIL
ncbi:KICSTOR complex protein SZT2-like isoform X4 [Apostichopus japonicus]|uniref:KICSTOR complex protein SZT2-like isoform X4 n=1 Tax=Stichopus japonicus TaxID=307972 RepID=UPI003AB1B246